MSGYQAEAEAAELMRRYRRKLADLIGLQSRMAESSATAASARQSVRVTVNGQGEITALEFPTGLYRRLPPAELSAEILAAARDAKAKAREPLRELLEPDLPDGPRLLELVQNQVDAAGQYPAESPVRRPPSPQHPSPQHSSPQHSSPQDWSTP